MKGFKNTTGMRSGFNFGSSAGFTGSTGKVQNISYTRRTPQRKKFAEGGKIDSSLHSFKADSELNVRHGPSGGLRPGFTRGGYTAKYAEGGKVPPKKPAPKPPTPKPDVNPANPWTKSRRHEAELGLAQGGIATYAKGGRIPVDKAAARALRSHVAAPAPKGHKGLKSC